MKKIFLVLFAFLLASCSGQQVVASYAVVMGVGALWLTALVCLGLCKAIAYWGTLSAEQTLRLGKAVEILRWLSLFPWALVLYLKEKIGARKNASSR